MDIPKHSFSGGFAPSLSSEDEIFSDTALHVKLSSPEEYQPQPKDRSLFFWRMLGLGLGVLGVLFLLGIFSILPPAAFPHDVIVHVQEGDPLSRIALQLKEKKIIRSASMLQVLMKVTGKSQSVKAGDYRFENPQHGVAIARRLARGEYGNVLVHLTIPEGSSLEFIATTAGELLNDFNADYFFEEALPYNGYLFPDTYYLTPSTSEDELLALLRDQFVKKLRDVIGGARLAELDPQTLREKVIMASILEREANNRDDIYLISGILWKRITIDMPLQVDASFSYLLGKASSELTRADLDIDSPYNTYKYRGLPPGPLGNPGELALDAAFHPAQSPFLYYLHDDAGGVHFAKTFQDHVRNKNTYLK